MYLWFSSKKTGTIVTILYFEKKKSEPIANWVSGVLIGSANTRRVRTIRLGSFNVHSFKNNSLQSFLSHGPHMSSLLDVNLLSAPKLRATVYKSFVTDKNKHFD